MNRLITCIPHRFIVKSYDSRVLKQPLGRIENWTGICQIRCMKKDARDMKRPHASESDTNTVDNSSDVSSSGVKEAKKKKKKVLVPPTPVTVGVLAADASIWDNAVLLIDKPKTWTSFDVCGKLRGELARALNVKPKKIKVGHAGTLDPMATGLLIVCVGKGTKSIDSFVSMTKEYSGVFRLGQVTDSYDADGSLLKEDSSWQSITSM